MNVIQLWKIYRRAQKLAGFLEEAQMSKSLFTSKLFWFNVLTAAATLTGYLPLDPATAVLVASGINAALRLITHQPITFTAPE